jgi:hypothetical protein
MRRYLVLIILFVIFVIPTVVADDITFQTDQKDYYFLTGQDAVVPLTMNNTYGDDINGMMQYSITQEVNQNGYTHSSTNSQSQTYSIPTGNQTIGLNFGTSNTPLTLRVSLTFSYTKDSDTREVSLDGINIYFVSNQSQMNNEQNPQQSSSEKITDAQPDPSQQQQPQTPQEKLQNNQMNQDSSALKDQIEQQLQEEQQQRQEFEQNLLNNQDFQNYSRELKEQGYNLSDKQLDSMSNDTGSFNLTYENQQGETATLQGSMEDGELKDVQKQTAEDRKEMMDALNQSETFQKYLEELQNEGYNQTSVNYEQQGNTTTMELTYENTENETATITATFEDKELKDVQLSKQENIDPLFWSIPFLIGIILLFLYIYLRYQRKKASAEPLSQTLVKKPFDYKGEARRLLLEAEDLYKQKLYKAAYGKAGQALRLYLSYEYGLKRELTNDEVVRFLKTKQYPYSEIKQCFDLCSLVEFAKYTANDTDFSAIRRTVGSVISG